MQSIIDFLAKLIGGFVDGFKMKNPLAFTVVSVALGILLYITTILDAATLPDGTSLLKESADKLLSVAQGIIVTVLTLLGAATPKDLPAKS